jgi:hypothetical protein
MPNYRKSVLLAAAGAAKIHRRTRQRRARLDAVQVRKVIERRIVAGEVVSVDTDDKEAPAASGETGGGANLGQQRATDLWRVGCAGAVAAMRNSGSTRSAQRQLTPRQRSPLRQRKRVVFS